MRANKSHRNNRRSHFALENPALTKEGGSGVVHLRHRASLETGMYRGRKVLDVHSDLAKKSAKSAK